MSAPASHIIDAGHPIHLNVHGDEGPAVVIAPAMGVTQRFYWPLAAALAKQGMQVVTFDYEGMGASRSGPLRDCPADMTSWAGDLAAVLAWTRLRAGEQPLHFVGHSCGGQLLGLASGSEHVASAALVASQSGHWRHWDGLGRGSMWLLWHAVLPAAATVFGYVPGWLGTGGALPRGVALQWARWGRNPYYISDEAGLPLRAPFANVRCPMRAYSFADDHYAPGRAVDALADCYFAADVERIHLAPADLGKEKIGHFGFFRKGTETTWLDLAKWLKQSPTRPETPQTA